MKILYIPSGTIIEIDGCPPWNGLEAVFFIRGWINYSKRMSENNIKILKLSFDNRKYFLDCPCVLADFEIVEV